MANCMTFILYAFQKEISSLHGEDLHVILDAGDMLYRDLFHLGRLSHEYLLFSELPWFYKLRDKQWYSLARKINLYGCMIPYSGLFLRV